MAFGLALALAFVAIILLTLLYSAASFRALEYREQLSLIFVGLGVLILGAAVPTLLGEAARLESVRIATRIRGHATAAQIWELVNEGNEEALSRPGLSGMTQFLPTETVEAVTKMVKGLTAGRVMAATGILVIFMAAVLAFPLGATKGSGDEGTGRAPATTVPTDGFTNTEARLRSPSPPLPVRRHSAQAYTARPKATPHGIMIDPHFRVRTDTIDKSGTVTIRYNSRLHHIGLGRLLAGTKITLLIADLNIRVINHNTGHQIRALTLDPSRDYQPRGVRPGPPKKAP